MLDILLGFGIVSLTVGISTYYISRKLEKMLENTTENVKNELQEWLNTENGQKFFFAVGALIGNGAKSGFGLTKRGGKFSLTDLIQQIAGQYITQKFMPEVSNPQSTEQTLNTY